jgi:AcrR family transcriptional regulator
MSTKGDAISKKSGEPMEIVVSNPTLKQSVGKSARMERKQQETHQRIMEAARSLFMGESGYEDTTVRKIADYADVSVGTVYLHFKSKLEIFAELVKEFQFSTMKEFNVGLSKDLSGLEQLKLLLSMFKRITSDTNSKLFIQLLVRLGARQDVNEEVVEATAPFVNQFINIVSAIIAKGMEDGSFPIKRKDPLLVATVLFQCIEGLVVFNFDPRQAPGFMSSDFSVDEIFTGFTEFVLEGLGEGKL